MNIGGRVSVSGIELALKKVKWVSRKKRCFQERFFVDSAM
jgi:hypothetical protein